MLRPVRNLPSNARILVEFQLKILSGGLRCEIIDPRRNVLLARRDFYPGDEPATGTTSSTGGDVKLAGLFFRSSEEQEVLIILSNYTRQGEPTSLFVDDLRVLESRSPE